MKTLRQEQADKSDQAYLLPPDSFLADEKQELEDKYSQALSELDQLKKTIHNFNHDLRNPLGGISGMIDLIIIEDKDRVEVQTSDLIIIKEAAQSLLDLIHDALVIRDVQTNQNESVKIHRNQFSVIKEINRLYLPMAQTKGISLSLRSQIETEIQLPPKFFINLMQITGNLVANALKFTSPNGSVDVVFSLDADENHNTLNMTVTDTGKSMSPDQVLAFNQGKPVTRTIGTNGEQGFGIGLQHVLQMVSEYTGSIFVKSGKDLGTEFAVYFPLPDKYLNQSNSSVSTVKNSAELRNGTKN